MNDMFANYVADTNKSRRSTSPIPHMRRVGGVPKGKMETAKYSGSGGNNGGAGYMGSLSQHENSHHKSGSGMNIPGNSGSGGASNMSPSNMDSPFHHQL